MATTKLDLYNGALRLVGERKLVSLTENRAPRRVLDAIWDEGVVDLCLQQGSWQWATRTVKMEPSSSVAPDFGYKYAYPQPEDYLRTCAISADEYFTEPLTQFADERGYWYTDANFLYVKYVSNDAMYGGDLSLWPVPFAKYVQAYMAHDAAPRITGVTTSIDALEKTMRIRLDEAQGIDGVNRPTTFTSRGSWNNARHGRFGNFRDIRYR